MNLKGNLELIQKKAKERTVKTQTIEYDLETLVKKIDRGIIKLNPDYQRKHRWDDNTSSRLIESLILNIPIPIIYISQDVDVDEEVEDHVARYSVIDGQQRLTSIYNFFKGNYCLSGLDVLTELNTAYYKDLPPFLIRRLEERTVRSLRIDSTADAQVKYDIFERLNSGSVKLEPQELRNATCRGPFKKLIKDLAKNETFKKLAQLSETSARVKKMEDQELVLRFFALAYKKGYLEYKGGFKGFLTDKMKYFNTFDKKELSKLRRDFELCMLKIHEFLGDTPFAKYRVEDDGKYKLMSKFNVSIFDAISVPFYQKILNKEEINISKKRMKKIFDDPDFFDAVEGSTNDVKKVVTRIEKAINFIA